MNEQLDKLESSVARLVQAYNELKQENENLKAQLADKLPQSTSLRKNRRLCVRASMLSWLASPLRTPNSLPLIHQFPGALEHASSYAYHHGPRISV